MKLERVGRYEIVAKIGQGAMGEVYRAYDPVLNRHVAVKMISAGRGEDETLRKRFEREARSAAKLSHPNIVTVFEAGQHGDQLFMAMELLEGRDLKQTIQSGELSLARKLEIMEQICEGLAFAHANEIVHRDLKPANIHVLPDKTVKIMDFGLARMSGSDMTRTGMVMGTPHYMSPEQVRGAKADTRSDVFSLGAVFYELLTGRRAFEAETMHAVLFKVMQEEPPPARDILPTAPAVLVQIVDKALAKDPSARFSDAGQMLAALRKARRAIESGRGDRLLPELARSRPAARGAVPAADRSAGGSLPPASVDDAGRRWGPLPWVVGALLVVAVAVAGILGLRGRGQDAAATGAEEPPEVQSLARAVIETQVELARRRLDEGDHAEAARQVERALKLDATNEEALEIHRQAREVLDRIAAAAAEAREASEGGDRTRAAEAMWTLMQLDPAHPVMADLAPTLGNAFRARAEEARRMMTEARQQAELARAGRLPAFEDGASLGRQGEQAFRDGQFGEAARRFLEARSSYERARRRVR